MPTRNVLLRPNMGNEFDFGVVEPNKVRLRIDNRTIKRDGLNIIHSRSTFRRVTASTVLLSTDQIVSVANGATNVTITLFNAPQIGDEVSIKRVITAVGGVPSTGSLTISGGATNIEQQNGSLATTLVLNTTTFRRVRLIFTGTFWELLRSN